MRKIWLAFIGLLFGAAAVVPLATSVDAAVTNCSKGTSGTYAWAVCTGTNGNPPYTTQFVVVATCVRPWYLGGGSYDNTGNWVTAGSGYGSHFYCAANYNATNPRTLYR